MVLERLIKYLRLDWVAVHTRHDCYEYGGMGSFSASMEHLAFFMIEIDALLMMAWMDWVACIGDGMAGSGAGIGAGI